MNTIVIENHGTMSNYQAIDDQLTERDWIAINKAAVGEFTTFVSADWTVIPGAIVAMACDTMARNFRNTETALATIIANAIGFVSLCPYEVGLEIRINTINGKELEEMLAKYISPEKITQGGV